MITNNKPLARRMPLDLKLNLDLELNRPLPRPTDLWALRTGFFWYNDSEIFHSTEADFDRRAAAFREAGINHVITFSCTHFRWSFRRHWELLTNVLASIVRACHRQGIYVTEHHSAILMHNPKTEQDWAYLEMLLQGRDSSVDSWAHFREDCQADPVIIDDQRLSDLCKRYPLPGELARSNHRGHVMCPVNPHYQRAYMAYLEEVYRTGVDGIMTDDVSSYCYCRHCQSAAKQMLGYNPVPKDLADNLYWDGDFDNPAARDWHRFNVNALHRYHQVIANHYRSLGLRLLRPNYVRTIFGSKRGMCLQSLPELDIVFQEAGGWELLLYSWGSWGLEAAHRFSVGRWRGIPSMLMTYPHRADLCRLFWALSWSWGGSFCGSREGAGINDLQHGLNAFEERHRRLLENPHKIARIGILDSIRAREQGPMQFLDQRTSTSQQSWMQACAMANVPYDLCSLEELAERLPLYEVLVLNEIPLLSSQEVSELATFVRQGGTLVWVGANASYSAGSSDLTVAQISTQLGLPTLRNLAAGDPIDTLSLGDGTIVLVPPEYGRCRIEPQIKANYYFGDADATHTFEALADTDYQARHDTLALLREVKPTPWELQLENLPAGVQATVFMSQDRRSLVLHLVNTTGILDQPDGKPIRFDDPVPFPSHAGKPPIRATIALPTWLGYRGEADRAVLHSSDGHDTRLEVQPTATHVTVTIDPARLSEAEVVEIC